MRKMKKNLDTHTESMLLYPSEQDIAHASVAQ